MSEAELQPVVPQPSIRWFRPTPGWLVLALLLVEGLLWLSERFGWLSWHKGYAVLIAVAAVGVVLLIMLLWFLFAPIFRWRFQFSIRAMLVLTLAVALPCSWLAVEMKKAKIQREAVMAIQRDGGAVYYEHQFDLWGNRVPIGGVVWDNPVNENGNPIPGEEALDAESPAPSWLRGLLGDDFFRVAVQVSVAKENGLDISGAQVFNEDLMKLQQASPNCCVSH